MVAVIPPTNPTTTLTYIAVCKFITVYWKGDYLYLVPSLVYDFADGEILAFFNLKSNPFERLHYSLYTVHGETPADLYVLR